MNNRKCDSVKKIRPILMPKVTTIFHSFFQPLKGFCLNRALIVLPPKGPSDTTASAFRPISLQNCPMKALAKFLTNRLKPVIPLLVHPDQVGFL